MDKPRLDDDSSEPKKKNASVNDDQAAETSTAEGAVSGGAAVSAKDGPATKTAEGEGEPGGAANGSLNANKLRVIVKALKTCEQNIANVVRLLEKECSVPGEGRPNAAALLDVNVTKELELANVKAADGRVVEGVFDGQNMVGSDGKIYSVPPNYASKSKLVEGDLLKLTITASGSFIYKQIGPIERVRVVAALGFDPTIGEYYATNETRRWNVLKASVTYYKGEPDDEVVILVPKNGPSKWAAVENIIKRVPVV